MSWTVPFPHPLASQVEGEAPRAIAGIVQPKRDRFCEDLDRYVARAMTPPSAEAAEFGEKPISLEELCQNLTLELLLGLFVS